MATWDKDENLNAFKAFWEGCTSNQRQHIINNARMWWRKCNSAMWAGPDAINALRNAGAYVHVHGIDHDGDWAIEITNWRNFDWRVFEVMGVGNAEFAAHDTPSA